MSMRCERSPKPIEDPVLTELRSRIVSILGAPGVKIIDCAFRLLDPTLQMRLTPADIQGVFDKLGVPISVSDMRRLYKALDPSNTGTIILSALLKALRALAPCRSELVENAWKKIDPKEEGKLPTSELLRLFSALNHPGVLKGELTQEEVVNDITAVFQGSPCNRDGEVTKEEFFAYYSGLSDLIANNNLFCAIVSSSWRVGQPNKDFNLTDKDFERKIKDGFRASAYWGCDGALPPPEPADGIGDRTEPRFASLISNHLMPLEYYKIGTLPKGIGNGSYFGHNPAFHKTHHRDPPPSDPLLNLDFEKSKSGVVPNGLKKSLGFLETMSTAHNMPGEFSDDVLDAYAKGKRLEKEIEGDRDILKNAPLVTKDPSSWIPTSTDYADWRRVNRDDFTKTNAPHRLSYGPSNRERTLRHMEEARDINPEELRERIRLQREATMPSGYKMIHDDWITTMRDHYAGYDPEKAAAANDRWADRPLQHRHMVPTAEEEAMFKELGCRHEHRLDGHYLTEKGDKHRELHDQADFTHTHDNDRKRIFDLKYGVRTMNDRVHRPLNVVTGEVYDIAHINQGQYKPMSRNPLIAPDGPYQ